MNSMDSWKEKVTYTKFIFDAMRNISQLDSFYNFDSVDYNNHSMKKLDAIGFSGCLLSWIASYFIVKTPFYGYKSSIKLQNLRFQQFC